MRTRRPVWLAVLVVVGCKSEKRVQFEHLATELNPILTSMKSRAAAIAGELRRETPELVRQYDACLHVPHGRYRECILTACEHYPDELAYLARVNTEIFTTVDHELEQLRYVRFDGSYVDPLRVRPQSLRLSDLAVFLLHMQSISCGDSTPGLSAYERCGDIVMCREESVSDWPPIVDEVRRLHDRAKEVGVDIVTLDD